MAGLPARVRLLPVASVGAGRTLFSTGRAGPRASARLALGLPPSSSVWPTPAGPRRLAHAGWPTRARRIGARTGRGALSPGASTGAAPLAHGDEPRGCADGPCDCVGRIVRARSWLGLGVLDPGTHLVRSGAHEVSFVVP